MGVAGSKEDFGKDDSGSDVESGAGAGAGGDVALSAEDEIKRVLRRAPRPNPPSPQPSSHFSRFFRMINATVL
jgi:hypothetical protein